MVRELTREGLAALGPPEHPKTKAEFPALTKAGYNHPLDDWKWQGPTYTSGPAIADLNVDPASYPQGQG